MPTEEVDGDNIAFEVRGNGPATMLSFFDWDMTRAGAVLQSLDVPLLLVQSSYLDTDFVRRSIRDSADSPWIGFVRERAPEVGICIVSGSGHFPQLEQVEAVNQGIRAFADRIMASRQEF